MALVADDRLGPYKILALIGKGGMGEVYLALDIKLDREVALKALPATLAHSPERLARFEREAKLLASLNHPNIGAIYGLEQNDGRPVLVLEYVPGPTLADRIEGGAVEIDDALAIAAQIATAMEAAHEKGIIHRDLKPTNVKITSEGNVKVLDFGLGKAFNESTMESATDLSGSSTRALDATTAGTIMGTAAYMSPEQARGKSADRRSDIFSFGCVLYEMLTGTRAFRGETVTDILAGVLRGDPDWSGLPADTPPGVQTLLRRCLQKDPSRRVQHVGDCRIEIEEARTHPDVNLVPSAPAQQGSRAALIAWIVAGVCALAAAGAGWTVWKQPPAPSSVSYLYMVPPDETAFDLDATSGMNAISPDGRTLAFIGARKGVTTIWIKPFDSPTAKILLGTEQAEGLFWSPDSRDLGFMVPGKLRRVEVETGAIKDICVTANVRGAEWNRQGTIIFGTTATGIFRVSADGDVPVPVTDFQRGENNHYPIAFLDDDKHFLYWVRSSQPDLTGIYSGSLDAPPAQSGHKQILRTVAGARYVQSPDGSKGYLLFQRGTTVFAQLFDPDRLQLKGSERPIAENVGPSLNALPQFSVSQTGVLTTTKAELGLKSLVMVSRDGTVLDTIGKPDQYVTLRLSPDGNRVALRRTNLETATFDLWLMDLDRRIPQRFTDELATALYPVFSPDKTKKDLLYASNRPGLYTMYLKAVDAGVGGAADKLLATGDRSRLPLDRSAAGIIYLEIVPDKQQRTLWFLPLTPNAEPKRLDTTDAFNYGAALSPTGPSLAFVSQELGTDQVYVQGFPTPGKVSRI
jgi:serine/threonine protein kinase/Tol biopolymer transport system component